MAAMVAADRAAGAFRLLSSQPVWNLPQHQEGLPWELSVDVADLERRPPLVDHLRNGVAVVASLGQIPTRLPQVITMDGLCVVVAAAVAAEPIPTFRNQDMAAALLA
jgi:hypothetical protein